MLKKIINWFKCKYLNKHVLSNYYNLNSFGRIEFICQHCHKPIEYSPARGRWVRK